MRLSTILACAVSASAVATALPSASHAQTPDLNAIIACSTIQDDAERLACFDATVAPLIENAEDLVVVNRNQVEAVEQDGFGLELPSLPNLSLSLFGRGGERGLEDSSADSSDTSRSAPQASSDAAPSEPRVSEVLERNNGGEIEVIRLQLTEITRRGYDDVFFVMANGQVWEHVGGPNLRRDPNLNRGPVYVEIRRASMGSYLLRVDGSGAAYRVVRRE